MTRYSLLVTRCSLLALAALAVPAPAAERLGRLFYTPEQRATLDLQRSKKTRVVLETEAQTTEKPPPVPVPEVVTFGGIVRRSDGRNTIWLNNRPIQDRDVHSGAAIVGKVRPDGTLSLQSAQSGRPVELKVGQRAEMLSGSVEEGYARGGLVPTKPEPDPPVPQPAAKPAAEADAAKAEREAAARNRERDTEDALRAIQDAANRPAPPAPPPPQPLRRFPP